MQLNEAGRIVDDTWRWLQEQYDYVQIAEYVVMPNHLHGIILLCNDRNERNERIARDDWDGRNEPEPRDGADPRRGGSRTAPTGIPTGIPTPIGAPESAAFRTGGSRTAPMGSSAPMGFPAPAKRKTLGRLIGAFKTVSTKQINLRRNTPGARIWQRDFYEHIIRDEEEYQRIRQYILNNPLEWEKDDYYSKDP